MLKPLPSSPAIFPKLCRVCGSTQVRCRMDRIGPSDPTLLPGSADKHHTGPGGARGGLFTIGSHNQFSSHLDDEPGCNHLELSDPILNRRMRVVKTVVPAPVVSQRIIDAHRRSHVVHALEGELVVLQLLQCAQESRRVAREVDSVDVSQSFSPPGKGESNERSDDESHQGQDCARTEEDKDKCASAVAAVVEKGAPIGAPPECAGQQGGNPEKCADDQ